jgi:hypothetical protein
MKVTKSQIKVNHLCIYRKFSDVALCTIDLTTKYVDIFSIGGGKHPILLLTATKDSLNLDKRFKETIAEITLNEFDSSWSIWSVNSSRYTVYLSLFKRKNY